MSNRISEIAASKFFSATKFKRGNTSVIIENNRCCLRLYGNIIAFYELVDNKNLYVSSCGYNTKTTRSRLNGLGIGIFYSEKYVLYFKNDKLFDEPIEIEDYTYTNIRLFGSKSEKDKNNKIFNLKY